MLLNGRKLVRAASLTGMRMKSKGPLGIHDMGGNFFRKIPQSAVNSNPLEENIKKNFHEQNLKYPKKDTKAKPLPSATPVTPGALPTVSSTSSSSSSSSASNSTDDLFFYLTNSNDQPFRPSATLTRPVYSTLRTFNHPFVLRNYLEIFKFRSLFKDPVYDNMFLLLNKFVNSFSSVHKSQIQYYLKSDFSFFDRKGSNTTSNQTHKPAASVEVDDRTKKINRYNWEKVLRFVPPSLRNNVNLMEVSLPALLDLIQKDLHDFHVARKNNPEGLKSSALTPSTLVPLSDGSSPDVASPPTVNGTPGMGAKVLSPSLGSGDQSRLYYNYNNMIDTLGNEEKIRQEMLALSTILQEHTLPRDSDADMILAIGKRKEEEAKSLRLRMQNSINLLNNPLAHPILFSYAHLSSLRIQFFNSFLSLVNSKNFALLDRYDALLCEEFDRQVKMEDMLSVSASFFDLSQLNNVNTRLLQDGISTVQLNNFYASIVKNNSNFSLLRSLLTSSYILELNSFNRTLGTGGPNSTGAPQRDLYNITRKLIDFFTELKNASNVPDRAAMASRPPPASPQGKKGTPASQAKKAAPAAPAAPPAATINNIFYLCFPVFLNNTNASGQLNPSLDPSILRRIHDSEDVEFNSLLLNYFNIVQANALKQPPGPSGQLVSSMKVSLFNDLSHYTELNLQNNMSLPLSLDTLKTIWEVLPNFSFSNSFNLYRHLYDNIQKSIETSPMEAIQSDETINSLLGSMISSKFISSNILGQLSRVIETHGLDCTVHGFNIFSNLIKLNQFRFSSLILNNILEHWDHRAEKRLFSIYNNLHLFFDQKASEELLNFFRNNLSSYTSLRESSYWISPDLSSSSATSPGKGKSNSHKLIKNNDEEIHAANKLFAKSLANDLILATIFFGRENKFSSSHKFLEYMELVLQPYANLLGYNQCVSLYHSYAISRRIQPQLMNIIDKNFHESLHLISRNSLIDVLYSNAKLNRSPLYLDDLIQNILQDNTSSPLASPISVASPTSIMSPLTPPTSTPLSVNEDKGSFTNFSNLSSYNEGDLPELIELISRKSNDFNSNPTTNEYQQFIYDYSPPPLFELSDITGKLSRAVLSGSNKNQKRPPRGTQSTSAVNANEDSAPAELSAELKNVMGANAKHYNSALLNNNFNNNNLHLTDALLAKFLWSLSLLGQLNLKTFLLLHSSILSIIDHQNTNGSTLNQLMLVYEELNTLHAHLVKQSAHESFFAEHFSFDHLKHENELTKILKYNLSSIHDSTEEEGKKDKEEETQSPTSTEEDLDFGYENYFSQLTISEKLKLKFLIYSRVRLNEFFKGLTTRSNKLLAYDDVSSSRSHLDLSNILKLLTIPHENEKILPGGTIVDIFVPYLPADFVRSLNIEVEIPKNFKGYVIEFDGPLHYDSCCGRRNGPSETKMRHLKARGYVVICVSFRGFSITSNASKKQKSIQKMFQKVLSECFSKDKITVDLEDEEDDDL